MDYDLSRLGSRQFEHLSQSLAAAFVSSSLTVFGDGPDGGREATFRGQTRYPDRVTGVPWNGYGVVQAKYCQFLKDPKSDLSWLLSNLESEVREWLRPESKRGTSRNPFPDYILIVTNVALSGVSERGGHDVIVEAMNRHAQSLGAAGWDVWDYNKIRTLLDSNREIRRTYSGFLTIGDVLESIVNYIDDDSGDLEGALRSHGATELRAQQWVRLGQAGGPSSEKMPISGVGSDLPIQLTGVRDSSNRAAVSYLIECANHVLKSSARKNQSRFVLVGGPGQGKTTITQLVCQIYRSRFLTEGSARRAASTSQIINQTMNRAVELGVWNRIQVRRWPVSISFSKYGEVLSGGLSDRSVLRQIAEEITERGDVRVTAPKLREWLKSWPSLIVIDGLDEVANVEVRERTVERLEQFVEMLDEDDSDALVVATTRPQGYKQDFKRFGFTHIELRDLTADEASSYAASLIKVRHDDDPDLSSDLASRVAAALRDEHTARLMRSPLQVTIMALLLEKRAKAPETRYALFDNYYRTIYEREISKPGSTGLMLERYKQHIDILHERVALTISMREADNDESEIPNSELEALAVQRLSAAGYDVGSAEKLADRIVDAAKGRLVLLAPMTQDRVGFDVRSLREYMVARALSNIEDGDLLVQSLRSIVRSAYWQNTLLLAMGRTFSAREKLRDLILVMLREVDSESALDGMIRPGSQLALELLKDDAALRQPGTERALASHGAESLLSVASRNLEANAVLFQRLMAEHKSIRSQVLARIESALRSNSFEYLTAMVLLAAWSDFSGGITSTAHPRLSKHLRDLKDNDERYAALASLVRVSGYRATRSLENRRVPPAPPNYRALLAAVEACAEFPALESELEFVEDAILIIEDWQEIYEDRAPEDLSILQSRPAVVPFAAEVFALILRGASELDLRQWPLYTQLFEIFEEYLQWRPANLPWEAIDEIMGDGH